MIEHDVRELVHRVRDDIDVRTVDVAVQVAAGRQAQTARSRRRVAGTTLSIVAIVAGTLGIQGLFDDGPKPLQNRIVGHLGNDVGLPWIADGVLHLPDLEVEAPGATTLVAVSAGAVYATDEGDVVHVTADGAATVLGTKSPGSRLISDPETGWVAWVDDTSADHPELVAYDTTAGDELGRQALSPSGDRSEDLPFGAEPVGIDEGSIYYAGLDADYRWDPASGEDPVPLSDSSSVLVARDGGSELRRVGPPSDRIVAFLIQRGADSDDMFAWSTRSGTGQLSPKGRYFVHVDPFDGNGTTLTVNASMLRHDIGDGAEWPWAGAVAFGEPGVATYAVGPHLSSNADEAAAQGPVDLINCMLATMICETAVADAGGNVILPNGLVHAN